MPSKTVGLKVAEKSIKTVREIDPEDLSFDGFNRIDSDASDLEDQIADHYQKPSERSRLRRACDPLLSMEDQDLASKYQGKRVSISQLMGDEDSECSTDASTVVLDAPDSDESSQSDSSDSHRQVVSHSQVIAELQRLDEDETEMLNSLKQSAKTDLEKGKQVRRQRQIWDSLLDLRIRIQKMVDAANRLPLILPDSNWDCSYDGVRREAIDSLLSLLDGLVAIRLQTTDESIAAIDVNASRKRCFESDSSSLSAAREKAVSLWTDVIDPLNKACAELDKETIDKWNNKVRVASGVSLDKTFKTINQSVVSQINNMMMDSDRLVKRTKLQRSAYEIIGSNASNANDTIDSNTVDRHLSQYNDNIFDDGDYYQQLLKELIESRMAETDDPILLAMKNTQLRNIQKQSQKKRDVDTKASKGRKIRFQVQDKIQNFMAAEPRGTWHDEMVSELFSSLLGVNLTPSGADASNAEKPSQVLEEPIIAADGFKILG